MISTDPKQLRQYMIVLFSDSIALQSVVLKVLCKVLNARLSDWPEKPVRLAEWL